MKKNKKTDGERIKDDKMKYEIETLIDIAMINRVRTNSELPKLTPEQYLKVLSEVKKQPEYEKAVEQTSKNIKEY